MDNSLIYVVEDNKVYNRMVTGYLEKKNFQNIRSFFSGDECIQAIKNGEKPDIVIQDYFMEEMNGLQVLRHVKQISPKSEFIFLTGHESTEVAVNTMKHGAYDYIIKDEVALDKTNDKIRKIIQVKRLKNRNKQIKKYMIITVVILILIVLLSVLIFAFDILNLK